jgi:L-rhamnose-H+ transport protein
MSAGMSFGLQGGGEIEKLAQSVAPVTATAWKGMPVLVVVLAGGFLVNFLWCLMLNIKNKTTGDYTKSGAPLVGNILFAGLAGAIWCSQFICFKTGEPAMGDKGYIGWAVLMASAILFSALLGILLGEWRGTSGRTRGRLAVGLVLLILSAVVAAYSGYLGKKTTAPPELPSTAQVFQARHVAAGSDRSKCFGPSGFGSALSLTIRLALDFGPRILSAEKLNSLVVRNQQWDG